MAIKQLANIDLEEILAESRIPRTFSIYLLLRFAVILGGFLLLIIDKGKEKLFNTEAFSDLPMLWDTWIAFVAWTIALLVLLVYVLWKDRTPLISYFFAFCLPIDMLTIYFAAAATGGVDSPIYHNVYFVIAIHAYYFYIYDFSEQNWAKNLGGVRYFFGGGLVSLVMGMVVYLSLVDDHIRLVAHYMELGTQVLIAMTLTTTARAIRERHQLMRKVQRDLQQARYLSETLSQALRNVSDIAKSTDREMLESTLYEFAQEMGKNLDAEYCSIGFCDRKTIEDVAVWSAFLNADELKTQMKPLRSGHTKQSLIGKVLLEDFETFEWDAALQGDILDKANPNINHRSLAIFQKNARYYLDNILKTGELRHQLIVPLYSQNDPKKPVGFIHIINRLYGRHLYREGFSDSQVNIINMIGSQLGVAFENYQVHQKERALRQEEELLNALVLEANLDKVFAEMLRYLNRAFDSHVAALWLPAEDGFGKDGKNLKIVLRSVMVGQKRKMSKESDVLRQKLEFCNIYGLEEDFIGSFLNRKNQEVDIQFIEDIAEIQDCWQEFASEFGSKKLIAIPIRRNPEKKRLLPSQSILQQVLGIVCLRPRSEHFIFRDAMRLQLERFSKHLAVIIEKNRYERRYRKIDLLKDELEKNLNVPYSEFYQNLVKAVREVIGAETCTLFMYHPRTNALYLKATTAKQAIQLEADGTKTVLETADYLGKDIYPLAEKSITGEIFKRGKPVLIYNALKNPFLSNSFVEKSNFSRHQSLVGAPIVKSSGEKIGVIRCNNKKQEGVRFPVFVQGNKDFMELIAGFIAMFVENTETNEEKAEYLNQLAHEFSTPLHAMATQVGFVKRLFKGEVTVKNPEEDFNYLADEINYLNHLIQDIQFQFGEGANSTENYDWNQKINLYPIIEKVQKLLKSDARFDRGIEIQFIPAIIPEMFVDKMRFEQVVFNLLQNAVKYSYYGGRNIIISYELMEKSFPNSNITKWHAIHMKNWGIGVEERELDVIFEAYKRGSNVRIVSTSGTGIGLSVSRKIIENHCGFLEVTRLTSPTIFTIFLPAYLTERRPSE